MHAEEESPVALLKTLNRASELVAACNPLLVADCDDIPREMLSQGANDAAGIRGLCGKIYDAIMAEIQNKQPDEESPCEQADTDGQGEKATADSEEFVNDSWIAVCEAAGVYSREATVFNFREKPPLAVTLTRSELCVLAQRHLNTALLYSEFTQWNGDSDMLAGLRASQHASRFWELFEQLPSEDQERFKQQIKIRRRYITTIAAEVDRCTKEEEAFQERVEAGLVSEAEVAAHRTPPFIAGYDVLPVPADGGPGPEVWEIFDRYREGPFSGSVTYPAGHNA